MHRLKLADGSFNMAEGGLKMPVVSILVIAAFPSWIVIACGHR
jgi:hypothetical protein